MSALSDHQGIQDQDPAERLASALRRIAVAVERREASAAASQGALEGALQRARAAGPAAAGGTPAVAANLDALIARLRRVLDDPLGPDGGS